MDGGNSCERMEIDILRCGYCGVTRFYYPRIYADIPEGGNLSYYSDQYGTKFRFGFRISNLGEMFWVSHIQARMFLFGRVTFKILQRLISEKDNNVALAVWEHTSAQTAEW